MVPGHPSAGACWWNAEEELDRLRRTGVTGGVYVEGWAVRRRDDQPEVFEHGWVELRGELHDVTPHNHAEEYFPGFRVENPGPMKAEGGIETPMHRDLTQPLKDGQPNPQYDAGFAEAYESARRAAEDYCRQQRQQS